MDSLGGPKCQEINLPFHGRVSGKQEPLNWFKFRGIEGDFHFNGVLGEPYRCPAENNYHRRVPALVDCHSHATILNLQVGDSY